MSHFQQQKLLQLAVEYFGLGSQQDLAVLEIGSYDVNGSIRSLFNAQNYVGVDLVEGPGVDVVAGGQSLDFADAKFDVVLSCEVFEHNPFWQETFENMHRMLKPGGLLIMTCASRGRREHGTTRTSPENSPGTQSLDWDYYRNLTAADFDCFDVDAMFSSHRFDYNKFSRDLYFLGVKAAQDGEAMLPWNEADLTAALQPAFAYKPERVKQRGSLRYLYFLFRQKKYGFYSRVFTDKTYQNIRCASLLNLLTGR
ncbi:class I SAM-dependent methyltransferase [Pseudomonadales bacterium]|nr:class I SAM-dependent methyltransferase [Pseudomonadales bacterium]